MKRTGIVMSFEQDNDNEDEHEIQISGNNIKKRSMVSSSLTGSENGGNVAAVQFVSRKKRATETSATTSSSSTSDSYIDGGNSIKSNRNVFTSEKSSLSAIPIQDIISAADIIDHSVMDSSVTDGGATSAIENDENKEKESTADYPFISFVPASSSEFSQGNNMILKKPSIIDPKQNVPLVVIAMEQRKGLDPQKIAEMKQKEEEERLLAEATAATTRSLLSAHEISQSIQYKEPIKRDWNPAIESSKAKEKSEKIRKKYHIVIEGEEPLPPPIKKFEEMGIHEGLVQALNARGIKRPTPIQVQGLPVALSGRDLIGIAFTGSGKTVTFTLPLAQLAYTEEIKNPIQPGEGPIGMILGPSRELQKQTYELLEMFFKHISEAEEKKSGSKISTGKPLLRATLAIGGESKSNQLKTVMEHGIHALIGTPGRVNEFLSERSVKVDKCTYFCLDEGDRMMDQGFDVEVQSILSNFKHQRQTVLFSATMPKKFVDFAKSSLTLPVIVNVGRAGAANLDVIQEVEYVKKEAKVSHLLECLQKTAPPALIFCERQSDVEEIYEYLILNRIRVCSIHGGKSQSERNMAIQQYKNRERDVLVATDVAAKGLDFPDIQHVILFDMPSVIEDYVHRIGRTGRGGKTGFATTFVNHQVEESVLADLTGLLVEAKQRVPPFLIQYIPEHMKASYLNGIDDETSSKNQSGSGSNETGCSYCGSLAHKITNCLKLQSSGRQKAASMRDTVGGKY